MNKLLVGRSLFTLNAVVVAAGGFLADMNATHIYNPRWPPHAKFHDGQTMAIGVMLAVASLLFAWRRSGDRQSNVMAAAFFGGMLYWSQAAANVFPGVAWTDPEFLKPGESLTEFAPQLYLDIGMSVVVSFATWLAWPRKAKEHRGAGGRLPLFDPSHLTATQKVLFDKLQITWIKFAHEKGVKATTDDGRLIGPFNPFLLHPEVTEKLSDLQAAEATHTTLPPQAREVVVLIAGAVWQADYELYAQLNVARGTGLSDAAITALSKGMIPDDLGYEEKIAARVALELLTHHRVNDDLYQEAERTFGSIGLYDITAVMGVYQTVCSMLALFEVPQPE